ncbi:MocR-like pyridoxine biosynthesis transcription factor PdxR [Thermomonospora amylolytica]|uniref:MocR-like pyridoxine biosynthesis transcription factor PdxR n=1 Tax=Thermomonospora amylolytica TaxID=1411117 RepID=UPI000E6B97B8|nr:PLP-dependent aminotransferase family protein [Thermomonospora amylolytica]
MPLAAADLPLPLDRSAAEPLTAQLTARLRAAIRDGALAAGERLPGSRTLAAALGVSRTVVMEAYAQLYAEGWLEGRHGSGTYVADVHPDPAPAAGPVPVDAAFADAPPDGCVDLRPGIPWVGDLNTPAWRRAWRQAAEIAPSGRADPWGLAGLRAALCEHMRRTRGVTCRPEQVVVTRGATNGLDMLAAVLRPGDRVGVEEPGYGRARAVLEARGAEVVPCPVDEHGLVVDALPEGLRLIYTTPSHQYPLGGVLPVPRRQALLAWARRTGTLVAEDDYDGEFRFDVAPLPALYGLDPETVVYLGTMSKRLTADIGVGWLVARPGLAAAVARRRLELSDRTAVVPQEAVRLLLERGDLDRHIRRMRAEYARRRAVVVEAFAGLPLRGEGAGLHLVVELPRDLTERVTAAAAGEGLLLDSLVRHYAGAPTAAGLVIGYGATRAALLRDGCRRVRALIDELGGGRTG